MQRYISPDHYAMSQSEEPCEMQPLETTCAIPATELHSVIGHM
jgi:hypothetical protein